MASWQVGGLRTVTDESRSSSDSFSLPSSAPLLFLDHERMSSSVSSSATSTSQSVTVRKPPTCQEAREHCEELRRFVESRNKVPSAVFQYLCSIESYVEGENQLHSRQSSITDFSQRK